MYGELPCDDNRHDADVWRGDCGEHASAFAHLSCGLHVPGRGQRDGREHAALADQFYAMSAKKLSILSYV